MLFRMLLRKKEIIIEKKCNIDKQTFFEGCNRIAYGSEIKKSSFGFASYVGNNAFIYNTSIGKFTCVGPRVKTVIGRHPTNFISIHPAFYSTQKQAGFTYVDKTLYRENDFVPNTNKSVLIGNDVWIGADVKILEGVTIGDGAIIAAGSIVTKDVEPYSIYAGVPAKLIRKRFNDDIIEKLNRLQWWNQSDEWLQKHAKYFSDVDEFLKKVEED